jgi:protein O-mannosyl-transferase
VEPLLRTGDVRVSGNKNAAVDYQGLQFTGSILMKNKEKKKSPSQATASKVAKEKKQPRWMWIALIILVTGIAYSNSLTNDFVNWDDDLYVYTNQDIRHLDGATIHEFFTGYFVKMYAPVTMISYALDYKVGQLDASIYHCTNLILHLLNAALVFYLVFLLTEQSTIAVISALFFGIHPLHVESVAWISERKDLLYSFFYLSGLITYISFCNKNRQRKYYFFTILLFLLSLLSKSAAVTFPLILILIDFYKGKKLTLKDNLDKIPFFLMAIGFGILSLLSQRMIGKNLDYVTGYTILDRMFLGAYSFAFYLIKSIFPSGLSALHPMPMKSDGVLPLKYYLSVVVFIGFVWLLLKAFRLKTDETLRKDVLFGLLFFLFTIALILFIPVGEAVVAERYTYLPYIGIFMIIGRLYWQFKQKIFSSFPKLEHCCTAAVIITVILFAGITYGRNAVWKDTVSLFSDVIAKDPDAGLAYNNRGNIRIEQKDFKGALEDFNKAIELKYNDAYNNRGILRNKLGDYKKALEDFNMAALHNKLDRAKVYYNRGIAKLRLGDFKGAEEDFGSAIQIDPRYSSAYSNRGLVRYEKLSNVRGAINDFDLAISLNPTEPDAYYNRGNAKLRSGSFADALSDYDRALQLAPDYTAAYFNKGVACLKLKNIDGACLNWSKASDLGAKPAAELIKAYCR